MLLKSHIVLEKSGERLLRLGRVTSYRVSRHREQKNKKAFFADYQIVSKIYFGESPSLH
jgi:hypothetical protein